MENRKRLEMELKKVLEKCWYLPAKEKEFWIDNVTDLPGHSLLNVLNEIKAGNKVMSDSIRAAIKANPDNTYLRDITAKIDQIKQKAFEMEEGGLKEMLDEDLEKQIENL